MASQDPNDTSGMTPGGTAAQGVAPAELQQTAQADMSNAAHAMADNLETVRQHAGEDIESLKDEAQSQIGAATEKAKGFASEQKDMAAGQLSGIAAAITKVADELSQSDQAAVAGYARDLAGGVGKFADTMQNSDVDQLMSMAQTFGRRQPMAFLGAAALAGFVASRFAMASAQRHDSAGPTGTTRGGDNVQQ
ncbi:nutrient deprivation-induced protein [uncultured Devosia sp.]|uniref:nutrient deprivation-induced protein n=1 Tax=uncultured Devosia sp. TaxID=211434 RepID=UPI0035CB5361